LSTQPWFTELLNGLDKQPWLGLLLGAVLTVCLQSSSAVVGVMQGLYFVSGGAISLFGILPIVFGSNIGTTSTALIACIGGSKESKKVAVFHMMFNLFGALFFMGVIYIFRGWLETINATSGIDPKVQISLCHLIFNTVTAAIFLPLLTPITKLIAIIFKDKNQTSRTRINVKELDNKIIKQFPTEGIILAREQVIEMYKYALEMFKTIGLYLESSSGDDAQFVRDIEASIDTIDRQLNDYLMLADKGELSPDDMITFSRTLKACKDIERIGDYGENLIDFYAPDIDKKIVLKDSDNYETYVKTNAIAVDIILKSLETFEKNDKDLAIKVIQERREAINNIDKTINAHFEHVSSNNEISTNYIDYVFVDIMNSYQRVLSHCSNIAKLFGNDKVYVYTKGEEEHFNKMKDRY
jgi:phosphate:Na+ symporter